MTQLEFDATTIQEAAKTAGEPEVFLLAAASLAAAPTDIVALADGTARSIKNTHHRDLAVGPGALTFIHGLLTGAALTGLPKHAQINMPAAVDAVARRGRHTIIARHCDLSGVALATRKCVDALPTAEDGRLDRLRKCYEILFELGFAVALAGFAFNPSE